MSLNHLLSKSTQLWLELPLAVREQAWQDSRPFSSPGRRWNAYLNRLCLQAVLPWLQQELDPH
ncbi:MAG: DUF1822 family protein, partial [Gemmatimonadaceae bacterium]|nr:DUF1822 family protein [Gloeobacterales cyanobacterium ES-bin-141]